MLATKCVRCKIISLTNRKKKLLDNEYSEFNKLCQYVSLCLDNDVWEEEGFKYKDLIDYKLYSVSKCQAIRKVWKIKGKRQFNKINEQPLTLHNQSIKLDKSKAKLSKFWFKIPIHKVRGGIWVPLAYGKKYEKYFKEWKLRGSQIIKKENEYFAHLTFQKEIPEIESYSNILAIDLGEKVIATVVCGNKFHNSRPLFLGKEVRGIRRHYAWLRKRLGEKKLLKMIKKVKNKESRKVNDVLHRVSRMIVNIANTTNSIIVLGDLHGIRRSAKKKGRRMRRIVSNMPYFKLTEMITYKAKELGIKVIKVKEAYTSKTCSKCGERGKRKSQGLFECPNCRTRLNADYNGAVNILKRSLEQVSLDGDSSYSLNLCLT